MQNVKQKIMTLQKIRMKNKREFHSLSKSNISELISKLDTKNKFKYNKKINIQISNKRNSSFFLKPKKLRNFHLNLKKVDMTHINSIIEKFKSNRVLTKDMFSSEKKLPLNSINHCIYEFLFKEKDDEIEPKKNTSDALSEKMMKKFNRKTCNLLDKSLPFEISFSNNIHEYRNQIINNYVEGDKNQEVYKNNKLKYNSALSYLEERDEKKERNLIKNEKLFYKLRDKKIELLDYLLPKVPEKNNNIFLNKTNFNYYQKNYKNCKSLDNKSFEEQKSSKLLLSKLLQFL